MFKKEYGDEWCKVHDVIESCLTYEQLTVAGNLTRLYERKYGLRQDTHELFHTISHMIHKLHWNKEYGEKSYKTAP